MVSSSGRPRASSLPGLIHAGEQESNESLKCVHCRRIFPRVKSLKAHLKIHTNEKPYECTYPKCLKSFRQTGQLKTHVKRHTGEKPFACPETGCSQRFIHSSRQCLKHPECKMVKDGQEQIYMPENLTEAELKWFEEYKQNKEKRAKRLIAITQDDVKRFKHDDTTAASSSSSPPSTTSEFCSGASTTCSPQITFRYGLQKNVGQYCASRMTLKELQAVEILCSLSKRAS